LKLDKLDIAIINSLMQDGRKSFRQIAKEIKVSTPTVEAHFSRMKGIGVIKNIEPIINIHKVDNQISALVYLKTDPSESIVIANKLSLMSDVKSIYMTSGQYNLILKLVVKRPEYLEEFIRKKIAVLKGITSASYQLITRTIKDSQNIAVIREGASINVKCDYCDNEIQQPAKVLEVGQFERYFCCSSCLTLYKQKYKAGIQALSK
jgi:Lrp/AsnC family transcriptional regulator, regulator for asnA, asnC and gidA